MKIVLSFFFTSDFKVNENIGKCFGATDITLLPKQFQHSVEAFYKAQQLIEVIHTQTYADILRAVVDFDECISLAQNQLDNILVKCNEKKFNWINKWISDGVNNTRPFEIRLVAFAAIEGILFSSSFLIIFYYKYYRGVLKGVGTANEFISVDEGLHCDFSCEMFKSI